MKISIFLSNYFASDVCETRFFDVFRRRMNLRSLNMSNAHDDALIAQLTHIHEYSFKKNQLKTIKCFRDERNVIFFAKTNYEKNMILYLLFALKFDIIILLIFSLNALKMNQCKIIQKLNANVKSCILNDDIIIETLLNEIKTKTYIHILTNSKLALFNVSFKKVLQTFDFCDRVCLVVIDETHLMKNWFNWRIKYDRFCELRSILSRIIFFFVTSIILEDELIAKLIKKLKFNENVKFIHESMNRKKIFFNVQNIHVVFIVNFEDLRFLIANVNQSLKKIILYEERIQTFIDVKQTLIKFHVKIRNNVDQIEKKIKCYNEKMSNFEKIKIYEDFSQLDFVIRILCHRCFETENEHYWREFDYSMKRVV
jgi:superfamily II DNA helicase RecQ